MINDRWNFTSFLLLFFSGTLCRGSRSRSARRFISRDGCCIVCCFLLLLLLLKKCGTMDSLELDGSKKKEKKEKWGASEWQSRPKGEKKKTRMNEWKAKRQVTIRSEDESNFFFSRWATFIWPERRWCPVETVRLPWASSWPPWRGAVAWENWPSARTCPVGNPCHWRTWAPPVRVQSSIRQCTRLLLAGQKMFDLYLDIPPN